MKKIIKAITNVLISLNEKAILNHKKKLKNKSNVYVGRSPSLASFFEETFATELSKVFPSTYSFYIDYPITILNKNETPLQTQAIYPDIMIANKNKEIKAIIELKLDLGHVDIDRLKNNKRDKNLDKAKYAKCNSIVGAYSHKEKNKNKEIKLKLTNKTKKIAVIATTVNEHNRSEPYKKYMKKLGYETIFLMEGIEFNTYHKLLKEIKKEIKRKENQILKIFRGI